MTDITKYEAMLHDFIEFPTDNKDHVTTVSAILFAKHVNAELQQKLDKAREALQELYDHQNGCPLPKYKEGWDNAMKLAQQALKDIE